MGKIKTTITINKDILNAYRQSCVDRGMKVSTRLEILAIKDMQEVKDNAQEKRD